ncbi:MAG TPA: hypothetical protein VLM79_13170 [Kofleriaceae bacterium]|nr:hypothetical protein [Kofleriaceae bacterium]
MMKRRIYLLALPLLSITACLDMSDQDAADGTSSQESVTPAVARSTVCYSHGGFCIGAPTIAFGDRVVETTGGRIFQVQASGNFVRFAFDAEPNKCVALNDTNGDGKKVVVRACTVSSALWIPERGPDGTSCIFKNSLSQYLTGHNDGTPFFLAAKGGADHEFQQFRNPGISCPVR